MLRKFEGKARLSTFLTTVIHNQFRDFRIQQWGRWRPSAAARRLGTVAVQLEVLLLRDGFTFSEAVSTLQQNYDVGETEEELAALAAALPVRFQRRFTGDEALARMAVPEAPDPVRDQEKKQRAEAVHKALEQALAALVEDDRLLLRLHFEEGLMVSRIARLLHEEQKPLYRRIYKIQGQLRKDLEDRGVGWKEAREALDWQEGEMELPIDPPEKPV